MRHFGQWMQSADRNGRTSAEAFLRHGCMALLLAVLALAGACGLHAQSTTGTILGRVSDATGAVIPNVNVVVTNTLTGESHTMKTNDEGEYVVPNLPLGAYNVETQAPGFKHMLRSGLSLTANQQARVDLELELGTSSESVEVHSDAAQVNTYTPEIGNLVDSKLVENLPLNGRNAYSLLVTLPGASAVNAQVFATRDNNSFRLNGGRATENSCFIDGGFDNDIWRNQCSTPPNPDAIQEIRVMTSNSDVEFGRMPGAFVDMITKSGSNKIHGSIYEFLRNDVLDAANYFQKTVNPLKQNQFGGTIGGPVLKNRFFLFGSVEELRLRTSVFENAIAVPTADERKGNFSASAIKPKDPTTGQRYLNDQIPTESLDKVALNIINQSIPLPNQPNGTYSIAVGAPVNQFQYLIKGDYDISTRQKIGVSWFQLNDHQHNPFASPNQIPGFAERNDGAFQKNLVVNHTWTPRDNIVNVARFNFMRRETPWTITSTKTLGDYGSNFTQGMNPPTPPRLTITGRFTAGSYAADGLDHSIGGSDTLTLIRGKHNIKVGTFLMWGYYSEVGASAGGGTITNNGDLTGNALADFMLGYSTIFTEDSGDHPDESAKYWHSFAQDTWQITPKLTLTLGARYELTTPLVWTKNYIASFQQNVQSTVYPNAPAGLLFYGDPGVSRAGRKTDYNNIGPRVGFAYDLYGNGKTSFRGGYGIYYLAAYGDGIRAPQPFVLTVTIHSNPSLTNPWTTYAGGNPFPFTPPTGKDAKFQLPLGIIHFDPQAATPYVQQINLSVQQQLTNAMNLEIAYVGTLSRKQTVNIDENAPVYIPGNSTQANIDARRPYLPGVVQQVTDYKTAANASYNALQVVVNQRFSHGLSFNANYTWAKSLDIISNDQYNSGISVVDSRNIALDLGPTTGVPTQIFAFSGSYETPKVRSLGFVGRYILSDWQANAIVTRNNGIPFNITSGTDSNLDGINNDRPNLIGNPRLPSGRSKADMIAAYFNKAAFATAAPGQDGNLGRNALVGPKFINTDLSFFRLFPIHEGHTLQFRAEMFNAFNHTNFGNPDAGLTDTNVGKITASSPARIMQFGLRYAF